MENALGILAEGSRTALGFFWKSGWAFVLGYSISAMIQAFVPKARLTRRMGDPGPGSVGLATLFGAVSSSCSFAALSAARSLILKGAHFVAAVAFMFASTNLVIELGILIFIFLGGSFVAAEIVGGLVMIAVSALLVRITYPREWLDAAREKVEAEAPPEEDDFDWKERIRSAEGWRMVGRRFIGEWAMVWEEILIGFTVAGFVAVLVPDSWWSAIFLLDLQDTLPGWVIVVENAVVAPFVAAATFIGSMGNIPLATVLNANGVLFAGILGFIYSDLMVPPLVSVNARYYGWRVALYIAGIMFVSIVITAVGMHALFGTLGITPGSGRAVEDITRFAVDYTFWLNLAMAGVAVWLVRLSRATPDPGEGEGGEDRDGGGGHEGHSHGQDDDGLTVKRVAAWIAAGILTVGAAAWLLPL
ncbi:MAG: permease [Gemmatimonadota bacterium]